MAELGRARYQEKKEDIQRVNKESNARRVEEAQRYIYEYLSTHICEDCAEDIVQSAFLRCYVRNAQFDFARLFRPWFLRTVANDALKMVTRQKRHISLDTQEDEAYQHLAEYLNATTKAPEEFIQRNEVREAIRKAFTKLSPRQKAAIILRYFAEVDRRLVLQETPPKVSIRKRTQGRVPERPGPIKNGNAGIITKDNPKIIPAPTYVHSPHYRRRG